MGNTFESARFRCSGFIRQSSKEGLGLGDERRGMFLSQMHPHPLVLWLWRVQWPACISSVSWSARGPRGTRVQKGANDKGAIIQENGP